MITLETHAGAPVPISLPLLSGFVALAKCAGIKNAAITVEDHRGGYARLAYEKEAV